jgi:protein O-mannosyl-transferase
LRLSSIAWDGALTHAARFAVPPQTLPPTISNDAPTIKRSQTWVTGGLLAIAIALAYGNSFSGVFLLDDRRSIIANPTIARLWPLSDPLSPPVSSATVSGRPIANLTFAVNRVFGGLDVRGYHALNLAIHIAAALALFGLVRRTLVLPRLAGRWSKSATPIAFFVAVLWSLHPMQTESVTYIVQRVESLMGFFYVFTLYAFVRAATAPRRQSWPALAIGACALGMGTKEVMVSAPLMVLLYDRIFIAGSFREAWRQHRGLLLGLGATWLLLGYLVASGGGNRGGSSGFGTGINPWDYWLTQPRAIVQYLHVAVWPRPLIFEYGADWLRSPIEAWPFAGVVLLMVLGTVLAWWRAPQLAFFGVWFFAILAPTSVMPGVSQLTVEHRMYLPLAALIVPAVLAAYARFGARSFLLWALIAMGCGILTAQRNNDYRSAIAMWQDTVAKRPTNPLAQDQLATALTATGQLDDSLRHHEAAVHLAPGVGAFHYTYAIALKAAGRTSDARRELSEAVRLAPEIAEAQNDLATVSADNGDWTEAIRHYQAALQLDPHNAVCHYNLGTAWLHTGDLANAAAEFRAAIRIKPQYALAHHDLAATFAQRGDYAAALPEFEQAVQLDPADLRARNNLANVFGALQRPADARAQFTAVLRADPNNATARDGLARLDAAFGPGH